MKPVPSTTWPRSTTSTSTSNRCITDVEITPQADDHLEALDQEARERVLKKLDEAREWTEHRLDPLTGYPYYKLRAGDYRAIITWNRDADLLRVEAVGHRRSVYDRHLSP